jgi:hypothetical protein
MNSEPQKPIEGLLHTYARRRREAAGPPMELHPATRNILQAEVARTYADRPVATPARFDWLKLFLPLAWATCLAAAALVGYVFLYRGDDKMAGGPTQLAQVADLRATLDEALKTAASDRLAPAAVPAPAPAKEAAADAVAPALPPASPAPVVVVTAPVAAPPTPLRPMTAELASAPTAGVSLAAGPDALDAFAAGTRPYRPVNDALAGSTGGPAMPGAPAVRSRVVRESEAAVALSLGLRNLEAKAGGAAPAPAAAQPVEVRKFAKKTDDAAGTAGMAGGAVTLSARALKAQSDLAPQQSADGSRAGLAGAAAQAGLFAGQSGARQRFLQVDQRANLRRNFNSPAPPAVLKAFEIERDGNTIRLLDADGSVYAGQVVALPEPGAGTAAPGASGVVVGRGVQFDYQAAARSGQFKGGDARPAGESVIAIRCAGQNVTLNKSVVFEGVLVSGTASQITDGAPVPRQSATQPVVRLQGRVTVGGTSQEIDALPASR